MTTFFDNTSHTNTSISVTAGAAAIFGTAAFWTHTNTIVTLNGSNIFRNAGQVYADAIAVSALVGNTRIENLSTGVISSTVGSAIVMDGGFNFVVNAGYITGTEAIRFTDSGNFVSNTGTLVGQFNTVDFGIGIGTDRIDNSGAIISVNDDAIQFDGDGDAIVENSGLLSALTSTAILQNGLGAVTITNSGTIVGQEAILTSIGADTVVNTGSISGFIDLSNGDDLLDSSAGFLDGRVFGGNGEDTLIGGATGDRLEGGSGDDLLVGGGGNDLLTGGTGADELDGGAGRDTAVYDNAFGVVVDLVDSSLNTQDAAGDIFISIENVTGSFGVDRLSGNDDRNVLRGMQGADTLDGRGGADRLVGGTGDDVYLVDTARDQVIELIGEGTDTVRATSSFTLGAEVENLTLIGTGANTATGNALANLLVGNAAANTLAGGLGNDSLTGGAGADTFQFNTLPNAATNVDTINDYLVGTDRISLSRAIFTEVGGGATLPAARFFVGGAAGDANDRIIYNATTGELFYDADGTGAIAQVLFARIGAGLALTAADFALFG